MKKGKPELTEEQIARLDALLLLTDDEIDTSDIPETPIDWSKAVRGDIFRRPEKLEVRLMLEDFVTDWFRKNAAGQEDFPQYINDVLSYHVRKRQMRQYREHRAQVVAEAKASGKITLEKAAKLEAEIAEEALPPYEPITAPEIAEVLDWRKAASGFSCRPEKQEIRLALDDFVIDWLQENPQDGQDFCEEINLALWKHIRQCWLDEPRESEWKRDRQRRLQERREAEAHIMRRIRVGAPGFQAIPDKERSQ